MATLQVFLNSQMYRQHQHQTYLLNHQCHHQTRLRQLNLLARRFKRCLQHHRVSSPGLLRHLVLTRMALSMLRRLARYTKSYVPWTSLLMLPAAHMLLVTTRFVSSSVKPLLAASLSLTALSVAIKASATSGNPRARSRLAIRTTCTLISFLASTALLRKPPPLLPRQLRRLRQ